MRTTRLLTTTALGAALLLGCVTGPAAAKPTETGRVLVFSKTAGFRHDSIPDGIAAVQQLGATDGLTVDATEDATAFTTRNLRRYDAVVFLSTTGDVLDSAQQRAFEGYIRQGGGYVGVHAAADTEYDWPFYQGGRAFYTGGGHTRESYADPAFRAHLRGGLRWATGAAQADCRPENGYRRLFDGTSLEGWRQAGPGSFALSADGTLTSSGGMGLLWYAASGFSSYSLKLDWKITGDGNSGVFVGFPPSDDPWSAVDNGYEVQIDATDVPEKTTGSVYGFQSADLAARDRALNPPGEWNTYEIRVEGERLRIWLNGVPVNDFTNTDPARSLRDGHIGIQNHGADDQVSFRDVRIKELPARGR
ncbi:ThuA domain-containing protein [Streptomyces griseoluteus]|uniref:ThuA domain-containing protein n=1 Tax=Streptomyces griseoluteus TaxID=29306 RepID=UPI00341D979F